VVHGGELAALGTDDGHTGFDLGSIDHGIGS
jgi:hypothetical protein